jgi:hypothetical protein
MLTEAQAEFACCEQLKTLEGCDAPKMMATGPDAATPRRLVDGLRAGGVDWLTILFKALPMILALIPGGAGYAALLEQLLAIFGPKTV